MQYIQGEPIPAVRKRAMLPFAVRSMLVEATVVWLLSTGAAANAQWTALQPAAVVEAPTQPAAEESAKPILPAQEPAVVPAEAPREERPPAYVLPQAGWPAVEFAPLDPLLDRPYSAQPGFFTTVEANVLSFHLSNRLNGPVANGVTGQTDQVNLGSIKLDSTVSPRFEVGYRFSDSWGSIAFGYGFLATQGRTVSANGPADSIQGYADKQGRLDYNMFDLTYSSREYSLDPNWNMRWGVGPRVMALYFDARGPLISATTAPGSVLAQSESNFFQGYGIWAFMDIERQIGPPGLCAFLRVEGTDFFARINQNYAEAVAGNAGSAPRTYGSSFTGSVGPSILREVLGISYTVPQWNYSRFMIGYQYEQFFQIGRESPTSGVIDTRGSLQAYGFFLSAEFSF